MWYGAAMSQELPAPSYNEQALQSAISQAGILHLDRQEKIEAAAFTVQLSDFFSEQQAQVFLSNKSLEVAPGIVVPKLSQICRVLSLLPVTKGYRVLELGSANGYTSALLQSLGAQVFSLEPVGLLAQKARKSLDKTKYQSVMVRGGSASMSWKEYAPFDAVVMWRSTKELSYSLTEDVVSGGRIVAPIEQGGNTKLYMWQIEEDEVRTYQLEEFSCGPYLVS